MRRTLERRPRSAWRAVVDGACYAGRHADREASVSGPLTLGSPTLEIPGAVGGRALTCEPLGGAPPQIPLPPEFG
jgi:hypothetical protein